MRMRLVLLVGILLLAALAVAGCAAASQPAPTSPPPTAIPPTPVPPTAAPPTAVPEAVAPEDPAAVLTAMAERLSAGDLEAGMAYWADDAIWYILGLPPTGSELLVGKEAIRTEFEREIADHLSWTIDIRSVDGAIVLSHDTTSLDFTRQIGVAPIEATGNFLVEEGQIVSYAWTIDPASLERLKAALAEMMAAEGETAPPDEAAASAGDPVSSLTVTFADGLCTVAGPMAVRAGALQVTVEVKDDAREAHAVIFATLAEGKDFADLMASTTGLPPDWAAIGHYEEVGPASTATYTIQVDEGPLYGICWARPPDHPIGNFGPLAVVP